MPDGLFDAVLARGAAADAVSDAAWLQAMLDFEAALVGDRDERLADAYSATCLRHVWWAQYFSSWLSRLVHASGDPYDREIARAELRTLVSRQAARQLLAENYVGIIGTADSPVPVGS
jgi:p-hydroxybenzoate 3-monooxygenase